MTKALDDWPTIKLKTGTITVWAQLTDTFCTMASSSINPCVIYVTTKIDSDFASNGPIL